MISKQQLRKTAVIFPFCLMFFQRHVGEERVSLPSDLPGNHAAGNKTEKENCVCADKHKICMFIFLCHPTPLSNSKFLQIVGFCFSKGRHRLFFTLVKTLSSRWSRKIYFNACWITWQDYFLNLSQVNYTNLTTHKHVINWQVEAQGEWK